MFSCFSKSERIDYAGRLERIESLKAARRMKAGKTNPMETFPQGTNQYMQNTNNSDTAKT